MRNNTDPSGNLLYSQCTKNDAEYAWQHFIYVWLLAQSGHIPLLGKELSAYPLSVKLMMAREAKILYRGNASNHP